MKLYVWSTQGLIFLIAALLVGCGKKDPAPETGVPAHELTDVSGIYEIKKSADSNLEMEVTIVGKENNNIDVIINRTSAFTGIERKFLSEQNLIPQQVFDTIKGKSMEFRGQAKKATDGSTFKACDYSQDLVKKYNVIYCLSGKLNGNKSQLQGELTLGLYSDGEKFVALPFASAQVFAAPNELRGDWNSLVIGTDSAWKANTLGAVKLSKNNDELVIDVADKTLKYRDDEFVLAEKESQLGMVANNDEVSYSLMIIYRSRGQSRLVLTGTFTNHQKFFGTISLHNRRESRPLATVLLSK